MTTVKAEMLIWEEGKENPSSRIPMVTGKMKPKLKCDFIVAQVTEDKIFIIDTANETGKMSVTNDAEAVCEILVDMYGNKRIIYKDTMDQWDELDHDHGYFRGFKPYGNEARKVGFGSR